MSLHLQGSAIGAPLAGPPPVPRWWPSYRLQEKDTWVVFKTLVGWRYIGDILTQLFRGYSKPTKWSPLTNQDAMECNNGLITAHMSVVKDRHVHVLPLFVPSKSNHSHGKSHVFPGKYLPKWGWCSNPCFYENPNITQKGHTPGILFHPSNDSRIQ